MKRPFADLPLSMAPPSHVNRFRNLKPSKGHDAHSGLRSAVRMEAEGHWRRFFQVLVQLGAEAQ
jgi:hypothetical protein